MGQVSVYQYRDARGILLYVGITSQGLGRQLQHMAQSEWYRYYSTQSVEHYETREDAKARETWLIKSERPIFNRQENGEWQKRRSAYLALFDPDREQPRERRPNTPCGHCEGCTRGDSDGACWLLDSELSFLAGECQHCGKPEGECLWSIGRYDGLVAGWLEAYDKASHQGWDACNQQHLAVDRAQVLLQMATGGLGMTPRDYSVPLISDYRDKERSLLDMEQAVSEGRLREMVDAANEPPF